MSNPTPISRLTSDSTAHNTLNSPPTVPIFFQMSPSTPSGDVRGIAGIRFQVTIDGRVVQSGTTPQNGRVDVQVPPGGQSTLQLQDDSGDVVAEYNVTVNSDPLDAVNTIRGQQQRLRMLGYQIGKDGEGNGVNLNNDTKDDPNADWERSILDFQADENLFADAIVGRETGPRLTTRAGA